MRPIDAETVGPRNEAEKAVQTLVQEQCPTAEPCPFAIENFDKELVFGKVLGSKMLSYDRVFRSSSDAESEEMIRGETPAWIVTALFLDGSEEVNVDFTVRRDVHGMTIDEIALKK